MNTRTAVKEPRVQTNNMPSSANESEQARQTKGKPWYRDLLCRCGIHRGKWVYLAEEACRQLRVCQRCGKTDLRMKHRREWQYVRDHECRQTKICLRCADTGRKRTRHMWGATYSSGSDRARDCERCGKHEAWSTDNYND